MELLSAHLILKDGSELLEGTRINGVMDDLQVILLQSNSNTDCVII